MNNSLKQEKNKVQVECLNEDERKRQWEYTYMPVIVAALITGIFLWIGILQALNDNGWKSIVLPLCGVFAGIIVYINIKRHIFSKILHRDLLCLILENQKMTIEKIEEIDDDIDTLFRIFIHFEHPKKTVEEIEKESEDFKKENELFWNRLKVALNKIKKE